MNLRQIETFIGVADQKSFTKAAKVLFLTQPTVSAHISELEKEMNARLFIRYKRHVELTDTGAAFYEYAKKISIILEQINDRFLFKQEKGNKSELTIAASSIPSQYLLPEILFHFQKLYPKIKFTILETDSANVINSIENHQADLGFTGTKIYRKNCKYIPFYKDDLVVITPNTDYYQKKSAENLSNWLKNEPFILRENGSGTRKEALKILQSIGIKREEIHEVASIENAETIKHSVIKGAGISILSSLSAEDVINSGKVLSFSLGTDVGNRDIYLVYNRDFPGTQNTDKILKVVKELYPDVNSN